MNIYKKVGLLGIFLFISFFVGSSVVSADVTNNLSAPISPSGDVAPITLSCTVGHAYTEALYNNSLSFMLGSFGLSGGQYRKYCENGTITFDGWNMNTVLDAYNGVDNWNGYIHTPFKYVVIDTTNEGGCSSMSSCAQYNMVGAWEGNRNAIYIPSTTCYNTEYNEQACTLAAGPVWTTTPYSRVWSDPRDLIPVPPPVGDPKHLPATISPFGDVPAVAVVCVPGHNYTLSLVHEEAGVVSKNFGVIERVYCYPGVHGNVISFKAFNLSQILQTRIDPQWWNYVGTPLEYVIKDTTGIFTCDDEYCPLVNLEGAQNNYDRSVYLPGSTVYPTVGEGPVFDTTDHVIWSNTNVVTPPEPTGISNVLFLPGLEASRLYVQKSVLGIPVEDQLWEPNTNSDVTDLYLNTDGTSQKTGVYTKDVVTETNIPVGMGVLGQNIYKSFGAMLDGFVAKGDMVAWQSYAYDWRESVDDIVNNGTQYKIGGSLKHVSLVDTLKGLADSSKTGRVTIVAHSNGGLLLKALLKKLEDDKIAGRNNLVDRIDTVILVASPQLGTPSALPAVLHGYDQDINPLYVYSFMNKATARELGKNMPGAYGLLPSAEYFNRVGVPVVNFVSNAADPYITKEIATYGSGISTYVGQKNFINGIDGRVSPGFSDTLKPVIGNGALLNKAEALHTSIDTLSVPASVHVVEIAGWGLDTLAGFQYNASTTCVTSTDPGCTGSYILDEKPIFTIDGDKTVVTPSAFAMPGEKWWVNLKKYNTGFTLDKDHKNIFEVKPIVDLISNTFTHASTSSVYLSNTVPIDTSNRLRLSVHSPVTLDAYDTLGNHTGKVCSTADSCHIEENIPNSGYYEFGEGKYINIPEENMKNISLLGTGVGTFTFDYQTVAPLGDLVTQSFVDIPVTPQTQASVTVTSAVPQLALDVDGNGTTDVTVAPGSSFDPISYLQIMKMTVDSLDISKDKKETFDKRIDKIIKSLQKNKNTKALNLIGKFKNDLSKTLARPDPKKVKEKKLSKTDAQMLLDMLNQLLDNIN